jgi:hypothetical protein
MSAAARSKMTPAAGRRWRRPVVAAAAAVALASGVAGCGQKKSAAPTNGLPPPSHVADTPHTDAVVDAWRSAGLSPQGFAPTPPEPYAASFCEKGGVHGVDTLLCEYADDVALERGQKLLQAAWGGDAVHTGVTLRLKRTVLSMVDRARNDPNGKTMNQLIQTFRKL